MLLTVVDSMMSVIKSIIKAYQGISRTLFPMACRFHPSCSQYALDAIEKYGILKGGFKTFMRILRCSPISGGGYDPLK
jgi:putative membrane protein insertion efficiency factor